MYAWYSVKMQRSHEQISLNSVLVDEAFRYLCTLLIMLLYMLSNMINKFITYRKLPCVSSFSAGLTCLKKTIFNIDF